MQMFSKPDSNTTSITEALKQDHLALDGFYHQITQASDADHKKRFRNIFTWELARHLVSEELTVFPAIEKHLGNGKSMAGRDREEHQVVRVLTRECASWKIQHG